MTEREIFTAALARENPAERAAFLDQVCPNSEPMRLRVETLLDAHQRLDGFMAKSDQAVVVVQPLLESLGSCIGPYKLIEQIGDGGMGVVYMAAQKEPVRRMVALKVIKAGMDTQQVVARFEAERQAMAMLNHPNIAKVLDAGATDAGRPYFVMELVKGAPITEFCDKHKLDTKHRLQLFISVCQAVQHAHQKGLIHRDIKPSNVMVEMHDVTAVPKVIDFGVAKAIGHQLTEKTLHSGFHQMVGTPLYMSPEQAGQSSIDIDTRSDIYSLGVLLYEILTGQTPFESEVLRSAGYDEMRRMIREVDPPRPSARVSTLEAKVLSTISDCRNIDARKFSEQLRGELDWIVMKALEKDRNRRYDTANEFADDVQRFLNNEAVLACPPSAFYRFRKLASRNRGSLSAATLFGVALIIGISVATWQAIQARDAKAQIEIAKQQIDERYRIAKDAVDTYLLRVTQDERLDHPSFRQLRQSLLEAALPYYDQLHKISPTDEQSRAARAETLNQLGGVKRDLGRFDESLESFEESAKLFDQLSADHAATIAYRQSLAKVLVNLADHYRTRGASSESLEYEQHALALRHQLVTENPDNDLLQLELAQSFTNVGVGTQEMDGRDLLERAIEIWQDFADRFPKQSLYREYLSLGYQNLAHRFAWDNAEEAIPFHELAIDLLAQLACEQPESKKAHIQWAQGHQYLADTLVKLSPRLAEARQHCEESISILQAYSRKHPQSPEVKSHLATSQNKLAYTLKELGELELAHETCESALQMWEQLLSEYPDMLAYEVGLAATQHNAGSIMVSQGQAAEGMSTLTKSRDRLLKILDRIGPHDRSDSLLRTITSTLADTRKAIGQDRDRSLDDEIIERKTKTAGEALRPSKFLTDLSNSPAHGLRVEGMVPSFTQTEEEEQSMKRLRNKHSRSASRPQIRNERPLRMEQLEGRQLLASLISVSDTMINEIGSPSEFVIAGSGGLDSPLGITIGPDNNVYVASNDNSVRRYNAANGQYLNTFVSAGSGGLSGVYGLAFGPDGNLYVASESTDSILKYNGTTGSFMSAFVTSGAGGLDAPRGVSFGPDGDLFVCSVNTKSIMRFSGPLKTSPGSPFPANSQTGATFVPFLSGGQYGNQNLTFGPDGDLYITSQHGNGNPPYDTTGAKFGVLRYDGKLGTSLGQFLKAGEGVLGNPRGMAFDQDGRLYVSDNGNGVHRFDRNGNFIDDLIPNSVATSISRPNSIVFDSEGALLIAAQNMDSIMRYDRGVVLSLSQPSSGSVTVDYAMNSGSATPGTDYASFTGKVTFHPGQITRKILLSAVDDLQAESFETFTVEISNATGDAIIDDAIGIVSIQDDDSIRQINIADSTAKEGDQAAHFRGYFIDAIPGNSVRNPSFHDGKLYVSFGSGPGENSIQRYDATTGGFIDRIVPFERAMGVRDIVFRDNLMYVASEYSNEILRFDASTGSFIDTFVSYGSGGLNSPQGVTFGPDSNGDGIPELYVVGSQSSNVLRYNGATGQPLGSYVVAGSGGLNNPVGLTFDPSGTFLYVASSGSNQILKYNSQTGAYVGVAGNGGSGGNARDVVFGPDGLLYVTGGNNGRILRFTTSGTYVDDYIPARSGGMDSAMDLTFGPDGDLYVWSQGFTANNSHIFRFGTASESIVQLSITTPSTLPLTVSYSTSNGSALAGSDFDATTGTATFAPGVTSTYVRVPIRDDNLTEPTENFTLNLSNPIAATIADGQAVVSILDNDPFTKFYVVNDATADRTYEYGTTGASVENYALAAGNTAPRGAASTIAGTTVWVVDANKSVYTYDTSGALQGSWAAGGLQTNAQLEGIATNGADVWLVDDRTDKVYRYAKAAPLTNGSPVPISSFSLNRSNTSPKDIVTDGNYLWVVNDSLIDRVFKYTIGGTFVGSWTITTSGASSPTGITLDPSKPSHIWIVDSGTDRVYQYNAAVELASGNKSANSSWALAAGNTNPQGIADPPPPVVGSVGKTMDSQSSSIGPVPMPWFSGLTANVSSVSLQPVQSKARSTDEFMSVLGLAFEQPKASVSVGRITDVASTKSLDRSAGIDAEMQDHDMEDLIGLVAHDIRR